MRFALIMSVVMMLPCSVFAGGSLPITSIAGSAPPATSAAIPAVPVMLLPFHAIGPIGQNAWISQAIDEDLAQDLSRNSAIHVVRSATTQPMAVDDGLAAARDAKATRLVSGSYQVVEDQLRINAEVIDVEKAQSIGQIKATGGVRDLFKLEDSLASQLWHILPQSTEGSAAAATDFQVQPLEDYLATHPSTAAEAYQSPQPTASPPVVYDSSPDYPAFDEGYPYAGYGYGYPYGFGFPLFIYGGYGHGFNHHGDHPHHWDGNHSVGVGGRISENARVESPQIAAPHTGAPAFHAAGGAHFGGGFSHR